MAREVAKVLVDLLDTVAETVAEAEREWEMVAEELAAAEEEEWRAMLAVLEGQAVDWVAGLRDAPSYPPYFSVACEVHQRFLAPKSHRPPWSRWRVRTTAAPMIRYPVLGGFAE